MFEKFLSGNADNFRQRYEGTYGFYRDASGKRILARIDVVGQTCSFIDSKGVTYTLNPDTQTEIGFLFLPPKAEYHNTRYGAMYVQKIAQRQWQRGICQRNTAIYQLRGGTFSIRPVDFANLSAIYEDESAPSFKEAFRKFKNGEGTSVAISRQFALCTNAVYLFTEVIGYYSFLDNGDVNIVLKDSSLWKTELADAFRELDQKVTIS